MKIRTDVPNGDKQGCSLRNCRFVCQMENVEATLIPVKKGMANKEEGNLSFCDSMNGPRGYYAE